MPTKIYLESEGADESAGEGEDESGDQHDRVVTGPAGPGRCRTGPVEEIRPAGLSPVFTGFEKSYKYTNLHG